MPEKITEQQIQKSIFNQIRAEVHERNKYRSLLEECLSTLEQLESINKNMSTNNLTRKIKHTLQKYNT